MDAVLKIIEVTFEDNDRSYQECVQFINELITDLYAKEDTRLLAQQLQIALDERAYNDNSCPRCGAELKSIPYGYEKIENNGHNELYKHYQSVCSDECGYMEDMDS